VQPLLQIFADIQVPPLHLPLEREEVAAPEVAVRTLQSRMRQQKRWLDRLVSDANVAGYRGSDVEEALEALRKCVDASLKLDALEEQHRRLLAKSKSRHQASRDYLEKLKTVLAQARAKATEYRQVITELVNFHIGADTDLQPLKTELTPEEWQVLNLTSKQSMKRPEMAFDVHYEITKGSSPERNENNQPTQTLGHHFC
jgi:hypothetical protein